MEITIYEAAKRWHKTPWEMKQMPAPEFWEMIQLEAIEQDNPPKESNG